ncbi:hypothetical protein AJ79_02094 [Helicocarpus griseus UAMH5409]|uniref:Xylanolytic transcriptional activator regulatory domain-containing protein n=1 Tax=Helicocarpus griseus UAMH5409 TaxID=1447875 RepID=A0A2B7Y5J7_9EURO|nr:hypothetical protein AJ79_02094 [Helicocarpus griseus UAMH5409]
MGSLKQRGAESLLREFTILPFNVLTDASNFAAFARIWMIHQKLICASLTVVAELVGNEKLGALGNNQCLRWLALANPKAACKTCSDYGQNCLGYKDPPDLADSTPNIGQATKSDTASSKRDKAKSTSPQLSKSALPSNVHDKTPASHGRKPASTPRDQPPGQNGHGDSAIVDSPESGRSSLLGSNHTHVPYFRYFGPTAIVPGYKQMVVRVREPKQSNPSISNESFSSVRSPKISDAAPSTSLALANSRASHSIPFYDQDDNLPVSGLVTHLCEVFFTHLGCNFPFLQRDRFLRDLKEKRVEPILVDAVCAMAARFSLHPLLTLESQNIEPGLSTKSDRKHAHQGQPFAHRAMCAVVDALSFPTLAVVQACLLLAYEEFGSNHDSGLWMYLGISIRMAQDLGIQKLEGMKFSYGRIGLSPKNIISGHGSRYNEAQLESASEPTSSPGDSTKDKKSMNRAKERERVDSFWAIFFLDRVISSGTGRPVTLRDDDIEIFFPLQSESALPNGWPGPFPPLMRIIHLYGRITDLLNAIKEVNHVTTDILKRLAGMESDLTGIYQRLSPKLHFNAANFQDYVKAGEGTNFILLHFWFHALIVLLHQPTLLHSFGGRIQQLFPNSRELSLSSAKTIADILAFAELIDAKSFIGNPFTSQPIYIAACAFLMESAYYSQPSSRTDSPPPSASTDQTTKYTLSAVETSTSSERNSNAKHTLLASAAKDNYQRCYKALKSLEVYWEGVGYILTVLDQKAKGIGDPQLYTEEEMENAVEEPPPSGTAPPGWKRTSQSSLDPTAGVTNPPVETAHQPPQATAGPPGSPRMDPSQAIGWALTGATDSAQPNLSFLYQMPPPQPNSMLRSSSTLNPPSPVEYKPVTPQTTSSSRAAGGYVPVTSQYQSSDGHLVSAQSHQRAIGSSAQYSGVSSNDIPTNSTFRLAGDSSYAHPALRTGTSTGRFQGDLEDREHLARDTSTATSYGYTVPQTNNRPAQDEHTRLPAHSNPQTGDTNTYLGGNNEIMSIESQDIDMNSLQDQTTFPFSFDGEFMPWLEYLPPDVRSYLGIHPYPR